MNAFLGGMFVASVALSIVPASPMPKLEKEWFSAQEIADLRGQGIPRVKRKVNELARAEGWAFRVSQDGTPLARARAGRGGGIEYHVSLLPAAVRLQLNPIAVKDVEPIEPRESGIWSWYDAQSDKVRAEAKRRLAIVDAVAAFRSDGKTQSAAVSHAAAQYDVSTATIWNWLKLIEGVALEDRMPNLAPRRKGGGKELEVDHRHWTALLSDYLRLEQPTWESCYRRQRRVAEAEGVEFPSSRTLFRKLEREVDPLVIVKRRYGREAHARTMPPQIRTVAGLHAMEIVNIDGHRWDVFVRWHDGRIIRPIMVAIQDVFSRKILAWRLDETENAVSTRLAFADLFRNHGIPKACLLDNGRAFASKWITGGAKTRFRFKIKPDDPTGLLPALGINPKWATPYHGQAKPIERAFRDLCDTIAKHPAFAGAYTGNSPSAKPENYQSRAVDADEFLRVVNGEIAAHNARSGRRTEMADGGSFDDVFSRSIATAPIGKAGPEQLRLALLTADDRIRTDRSNGSINVAGNLYWCEELAKIAGQRVVVRFDPDNLHSEIHVYSQTGAFLATAPIWSAQGFADMGAANRLRKRRVDARKATKKAEEALGLLGAEELAALQPAYAEPVYPEPKIVRPVRHRGHTAAALKAVPETLLNTPEEGPKVAPIDRLARIGDRHLRAVD